MPRKSLRGQRPNEIVMDELDAERFPWDLKEHLDGCLAGYQTTPTYGSAVFFALEALWGIAHDQGARAKVGEVDPDLLDNDWVISPSTDLKVPWIWIRSLATAWEKYKEEGGPLGQAFGLEGGQGKRPEKERLQHLLDERAIARWIWSRVQDDRAAKREITIEVAIQEAAEKFGKSDETVRRAWKRFGRLERLRPARGS
jgi:hypothetical protein